MRPYWLGRRLAARRSAAPGGLAEHFGYRSAVLISIFHSYRSNHAVPCPLIASARGNSTDGNMSFCRNGTTINNY